VRRRRSSRRRFSAIAVVVVIAVIIAIAERRDLCTQPRDGEVLDLERPAGIDRGLRAGKGQVEREIRSVDEFAVKAESRARRKQQAARCAIVGNAVEIAELGDDFAARIDHHDLVLLIGVDPEIVLGVDRDAVGRVDAGGEERGRSRRAVAVHRDLDDGVISGVGYEHRRTRPVELDPVGAERRVEVCAGHEQRIGRDPLAQAIAILVGLPDDALERIRDVDIACRVKADRVGAAAAPSEATNVVVLVTGSHLKTLPLPRSAMKARPFAGLKAIPSTGGSVPVSVTVRMR
jgi:hypothetical protein